MYEKLYSYVIEVAKHGSITTAANKLYVSPSTLSKAIQKLEADLGVPLFDRIGKTFSPTYAGNLYIQRAQEILSLQDQLMEEMQDIVSLHTGKVRIGLQMNTAPQTVQAVERFHKQYPRIEICIIEDSSADLARMLGNGELDLVISNADPEIQRDFELVVLTSSQLVVAVPRNHLLVKRAIWTEAQRHPQIQLTMCEKERFILPPGTKRMGAFLEDILSSRGIKADVPIRASSVGTILRMVSCEMGITITYDKTAEPYENSLNLSLLAFDHAPIRSLVISTCKDRYLSEAAQRFIDICTEFFDE